LEAPPSPLEAVERAMAELQGSVAAAIEVDIYLEIMSEKQAMVWH
jgi:hypothetical protein